MNLGSGYLPDFIHQGVAKAPSAGQGVHGFLYWLALKLHPYRSVNQIHAILREFGDNCGRYVPNQEIEDAIRNSFPYAWQGRGPMPSSAFKDSAPVGTRIRPWPDPDHDLIEEICQQGPSLAELREASPDKVNDQPPHTEEVIDATFPADPWLCCGVASYDFSTRRRSEWRGTLATQSLIVPSAMLGRYGFTKDGRVSEHAQSAVGPRQHLIVEFDFALKSRDGLHDTELAPLIRRLDACGIGIADACAALLMQLARFAPLTLVVHSGGKSLHGWFPCAGIPEDALRSFMCYACQLGADPKTWTSSQFVRIPGGTRYGDGKKPRQQHVCFWNPEALSYA
jgi:hypothetical protein